MEEKTSGSQIEGKTKKKYSPPVIREVWSEEIGMSGVYLLEM
jgi:hypothetical protein